MSLETPRSSAGFTTPRTFDEVFSDHDDFHQFLNESNKCIDEQEELWSCSSSISDLSSNDDVKLNAVVSRLVNTCLDCDKCENGNGDSISLLEIKFTEELMARHRQMQLMIEYEKKIRDWFSEKNALIEKLKQDKYDADVMKIALAEKLETVSRHLLSLEDAFNDVHKKYERAKSTIQILNYNTGILKSSLQDYEECMKQKQLQFDQLKEHAVEKLNQANVQLDQAEKSFASQHSSLLEALKNSETKAQQLTGQLEQKERENAELLRICDFLLQTFKEPKNYSSDDLIQSNVAKWLNDTRNISNLDEIGQKMV